MFPSSKDKPINRSLLTSPLKEDREPTRSPLASRSTVKVATPRTSTLPRTTTTMITITRRVRLRVELDRLGDKDKDRGSTNSREETAIMMDTSRGIVSPSNTLQIFL